MSISISSQAQYRLILLLGTPPMLSSEHGPCFLLSRAVFYARCLLQPVFLVKSLLEGHFKLLLEELDVTLDLFYTVHTLLKGDNEVSIFGWAAFCCRAAFKGHIISMETECFLHL